jgi:hypothetical protein
MFAADGRLHWTYVARRSWSQEFRANNFLELNDEHVRRLPYQFIVVRIAHDAYQVA